MKKIHSILFVGILTRLYHISFPIIGWHSWRQSDTASIARNFFENGFHLLYPQVNWGGAGTGFVESEFQLYPFMVSILYTFFGFNDMWGRILSVFFSLFTIYGLYLLVKKIISENAALWSSFIYAILPLNIYYSRAFMPESMMLMCSVYGIYFFSEYLDKEKLKYLFLTWVFVSLAILLKLPALYLGLPLFYLAFRKYKYKLFINVKLLLLALIILIPVFLWYYHAHELFINGGVSFGIWTFGKDKWGLFGDLLKPSFYHRLFLMSIAERHLTYPGFILFIAGLFIKRENKAEKLFDIWLLAVLVFFMIASQANLAQEYYQLPFMLPASVYIGKIFSKYLNLDNFKESLKQHKLISGLLSLFLILIITLSFLRMQNFMKAETNNAVVFKIADDIKRNVPKSDLVITVSDGNPVLLYNSDRKGWTALPQILDTSYIDKKYLEGAKWLTGEKSSFEREKSMDKLNIILKTYKVIKQNDEYFLIELVRN